MRIQSLFLIFLLSAFAIFSCQQTTESDDKLELDQIVEEQAAFGFQINELASTGTEIEQVTSDPFDVEYESELPGGTSVSKLKRRAIQMAAMVNEVVSELPVLAKTAGDSAIWFQETYSNGYGRRSALYYNDETGKGRWVEVTFQFPDTRNMIYDSAEVSIDMNFTLWNSDDDLIEGFFQQQLFKETYFIQSIESEITVTSYDDGEPDGVTASVDSRYHADRFIQKKLITATLDGDESGSVREDFWFKDGTTAYAEFTFNDDNTGTFEKKRRDGTLITGTFNQLEDDGYGSYTSLIDFPSGHYLDQILRAANVWIEGVDSVFRADYAEKIIFSNGNIDSTQTSVVISEDDGVTTTVMDVVKRNGAHGTITITASLEVSTLSGTWTTWDGYYIVVSAEYYIDGSSHMHYEVYANEDAYNNGDDALIVADYTFNGDQGGEGTLTYDGTEYDVEFDGSGTATISDGTETKKINMYF